MKHTLLRLSGAFVLAGTVLIAQQPRPRCPPADRVAHPEGR